jgi:trans-aconitate methyltransferase
MNAQAVRTQLGADFDYDLVWDAWDDMRAYGPMGRHTRRLVWTQVKKLAFRSVLDVGCGQGSPLEEIAKQRPEVELAGVDLSARAVEMARLRMPQGRFDVLDITTESLDRQFDLLVCTDVVEHIPDDRAAFRNMRKMTRRWCLVGTMQGHMRPWEARVGHVRNYAPGELAAKMEEAGFKIRHHIDWGFPFYSPLYRSILPFMPPTATQGKFGPGRRLISEAMYYLFLLNASRFGDYVFCLGEAV